jgi:hypothetical protein
METTIVTHSDLLRQLAILKVEKGNYEEVLKFKVLDVVASFNITSLFKISAQQERPFEFAKSGLIMVVNLFTSLMLGKHRSIKGYLSSVMVERFTTVLIENNLVPIISGISSLFKKMRQNSED